MNHGGAGVEGFPSVSHLLAPCGAVEQAGVGAVAVICRIHSYSSLSRETHLPQEGDGVAHVEPGLVYFLKQQQICSANGEGWAILQQHQVVVVIFYTLFLLRTTDVCISAPSITTETWDSARAEETTKNPEEVTLSGMAHS